MKNISQLVQGFRGSCYRTTKGTSNEIDSFKTVQKYINNRNKIEIQANKDDISEMKTSFEGFQEQLEQLIASDKSKNIEIQSFKIQVSMITFMKSNNLADII